MKPWLGRYPPTRLVAHPDPDVAEDLGEVEAAVGREQVDMIGAKMALDGGDLGTSMTSAG